MVLDSTSSRHLPVGSRRATDGVDGIRPSLPRIQERGGHCAEVPRLPVGADRDRRQSVAECMVRAPKLGKDALIIVNLSGRGDKDVAQVAEKVKLQMPK